MLKNGPGRSLSAVVDGGYVVYDELARCADEGELGGHRSWELCQLKGGVPSLRARLPQLRGGVAAPARAAGDARRDVAHHLGAHRSAVARSAGDGAPAPAALDQRDVDVPRSRLLPGAAAQGHSASAQLSVRAHLARRLLDGRRGLLDGDPAARGGHLRSLPHLRHRLQRGGAAARARRHRSARRHAGVLDQLPARRRARLALGLLHGQLRSRDLPPDAEARTSSSRSTTSSPTAASTSSTSSCAAT